jgi:hypothetical protein
MLMHDLSAQLVKHLDVIVTVYAVLFGAGGYAWWRDQQWMWEAGLFVLSMVIMPLVYLVMYLGVFPIAHLFSSHFFVASLLFTPQFPLLVLLACCFVRPLMRQDVSVSPVLLLGFVLNTAGGLWTYLVLNEHPSTL